MFVLGYLGEHYAGQVENLLIQIKIVQTERKNGLLSLEEFSQKF